MALAFGRSFQLPPVIVGLAWLEIVTPERLAGFRGYALLGRPSEAVAVKSEW